MPASEVMNLYRQHKLHSGPGGPIVKSKKQAKAIQISLARKEGHDIPVKGSFQHGGLVPETGNYKVHQGEQVHGFAKRVPSGYPASSSIEDRRSDPNVSRIGAITPTSEADARQSQAEDIAARTRGADQSEWRAAMRPHTPYELVGPPPTTSAHYAVEGLQGNVAQRMREQGEAQNASRGSWQPAQVGPIRGSFQEGGTVPQTGNYQVHQGEELVPYAGATQQNFSYPMRDTEVGAPPEMAGSPGMAPTDLAPDRGGPAKPSRFSLKVGGGGGDNPFLSQMQSAVAAPLHRVEGFKHGGTIPRTGIYRLHAGEHVIPKSLAGRYREMKEHG